MTKRTIPHDPKAGEPREATAPRLFQGHTDEPKERPAESCYTPSCRKRGYTTHTYEVGRTLQNMLEGATDCWHLSCMLTSQAEKLETARELYERNGLYHHAELFLAEKNLCMIVGLRIQAILTGRNPPPPAVAVACKGLVRRIIEWLRA